MVLSLSMWFLESQIAYTFYANLSGPDAVVYGKSIGMGIQKAAKNPEFDYSKRGRINLFA